MRKTLKASVTVWLSGGGIAGVVGAIATGQIDPIVGGIACLLFGAQIFMRRAIGDEQAAAVSMAMTALAQIVVKYKTADGMIPMAKLVEIIHMADPKHDPFKVVDGGP